MSLQDSIAAGYKITQDANLQTLSDTLGCKLEQAPTILQKSLALATLIKPTTLAARQQTIRSLRMKAPAWESHFTQAASIEQELSNFFKTASEKDSLESDAIAQLSFQDEWFKPLNQAPFMILVMALFKIWVVPTMTLLTPIVAWILPYILLRFVYALPIEQQEYVRMLQGMWVGQMGTSPGVQPDMYSARSIAQFIIFGFTFAQSMIQPIQNALHLNKTDSVIVDFGKKLLALRDLVRAIRKDLGDLPVKLADTLEELDETDSRRAFLLIKDEPERLRIILQDLANLEILWRISQNRELRFVVFKPDLLFLSDMRDISLKDPIPSSLALPEAGQHHAIITGPNGGGKSSFLRAALQCVVLGHTYGVAPAVEAIMPRFDWIASGLQLRDTPGKYSMFETEVKFAADCLRASREQGKGFVLFDELFHSTNPPDGVRSAELFLKKLWASGAYSVVSTHIFPLVEKRPDTVQAICCPATQEDGRITYSYRAEGGICRVSSVHTVWEKYGL